MDRLKTQDTIAYDKNNQEVVVRTKRRRIMGAFSAIGKLSAANEEQTDIFDLLDQVSKGAFSLFTAMKRHRNAHNNLVFYNTRKCTKTQKETFSRQLKELRKLSIVQIARARMDGQDPRRPYVCERQTYMINPDLLKCWDFEDAALLWSQCKP